MARLWRVRQSSMNRRFLFRELNYNRGQAIIFILCVALSLVSIVAINGLRRDIHQSLQSDARNLTGGDIILHSHYPFSNELLAAVSGFVDTGQVLSSHTWEFMSMTRDSDSGRTVLSQVKGLNLVTHFTGKLNLLQVRALHRCCKKDVSSCPRLC